MDFTPLNDQELRELNLYPEGRYRFRVMRTEQKRSKAGSDYFNLRMNININGKDRTLFDMLFFEGKMMFKTKHFCEITGMLDKYEKGKLMPFECDGKEGWLDLTQRVNQQTGELQNSVKDYVTDEEEAQIPPIQGQADNFFNDEIKF